MHQRKTQQHEDGLELVPADVSTVAEFTLHRGSAQRNDLSMVVPRTTYHRRFKRALDVALGSAVAVASAPISLAIAAAVRVGLGKPVLYEQERIGENGETFTIYKFRTMRPDRRQQVIDLTDGADRRSDHKSEHDPRHTGLGRKMRELSLDELPQLINVIRGDMSLVGPRPEIPKVAAERGYVDHIRHAVKPGMTGPYQTSDARLNGDLRDGLHLDADYVENVTLRRDLSYLSRTVAVIFRGRSGS